MSTTRVRKGSLGKVGFACLLVSPHGFDRSGFGYTGEIGSGRSSDTFLARKCRASRRERCLAVGSCGLKAQRGLHKEFWNFLPSGLSRPTSCESFHLRCHKRAPQRPRRWKACTWSSEFKGFKALKPWPSAEPTSWRALGEDGRSYDKKLARCPGVELIDASTPFPHFAPATSLRK